MGRTVKNFGVVTLNQAEEFFRFCFPFPYQTLALIFFSKVVRLGESLESRFQRFSRKGPGFFHPFVLFKNFPPGGTNWKLVLQDDKK